MLPAIAAMKLIEPPDLHHLRAAMGWLELGNHKEATEEWKQITPSLQVHPDVLEIRWEICAMAMEWDICVDIASAIVELAPERPFGWIGRAYSLRRVEGGGLIAAFMTLLLVAEEFPAEPMIPFNLSCYTCQMGRLDDARAWLHRAFAVASMAGTKKRFKHMAMEEPDLEPLRRKVPKRRASSVLRT
jgi:hypothetical protein